MRKPVVKAMEKPQKKDLNAMLLTRLEKDGMTRGEINKGPTAGNGDGASSLEIRTGNLSKSVNYPVDTPTALFFFFFFFRGALPSTETTRLIRDGRMEGGGGERDSGSGWLSVALRPQKP